MTGPAGAVRTLGEGDLERIVALHGRAFPGSVLTRLGPEVVAAYYRWQVTGPHESIAVGVLHDADLAGLLIGGRFHGSAVGFVQRNVALLATKVIRHPSVLGSGRGRRALATGVRLLARRNRRPAAERPERVPDGSFGVLVVAVDPAQRRRGVGRRLLAEAEAQAIARGFVRMHLTLDPTNDEAVRFYQDMGWRRLGLPGDTDHQWLMGKDLAGA